MMEQLDVPGAHRISSKGNSKREEERKIFRGQLKERRSEVGCQAKFERNNKIKENVEAAAELAYADTDRVVNFSPRVNLS